MLAGAVVLNSALRIACIGVSVAIQLSWLTVGPSAVIVNEGLSATPRGRHRPDDSFIERDGQTEVTESTAIAVTVV
jgi:hypothetical protein